MNISPFVSSMAPNARHSGRNPSQRLFGLETISKRGAALNPSFPHWTNGKPPGAVKASGGFPFPAA